MNKKLYEFIASKIKELRDQYGGQGISQETLAEKVGVQPNTVSRWETAIYKPKVHDLEKLAKFFGVPITVFLPDQPTDSPELNALLSATADLHAEDIKALTEFAQFRKMRKTLEESKKK